MIESVLAEIIHHDQAGFLLGHQMKNNIMNIIDIIEYLEVRNEKVEALMFIDAEKAFDNVSWLFMKKKLERIEVGQDFLNGINAIYFE